MTNSPLQSSADFRRVLTEGDRTRRGGVTVVSHPGPESAIRVGLVAGRAVGNAVRRNRVKRRLRHALKEIQLEQGMDYVIIADRRVGDAPFGQLKDWLEAAIGVRR